MTLKSDRQQDHHDQSAGELRGDELPAEQDQQRQAELEDEVRRRELEDDRVGKRRSLAEQRSRDGDRGVGARRRRRAEERREARRAGRRRGPGAARSPASRRRSRRTRRAGTRAPAARAPPRTSRTRGAARRRHASGRSSSAGPRRSHVVKRSQAGSVHNSERSPRGSPRRSHGRARRWSTSNVSPPRRYTPWTATSSSHRPRPRKSRAKRRTGAAQDRGDGAALGRPARRHGSRQLRDRARRLDPRRRRAAPQPDGEHRDAVTTTPATKTPSTRRRDQRVRTWAARRSTDRLGVPSSLQAARRLGGSPHHHSNGLPSQSSSTG